MGTGKAFTRNALRFSLFGVVVLAMIQQGAEVKGAPLDSTGILPARVAGATTLARLAEPDATTKAQVVEAYGMLPLSFEANQEQTDARVEFLSRGPGYTFFLTPTEAVMALKGRQSASSGEIKANGQQGRSVVRIKLVGGNADPKITGSDQPPGKSNYFIGNDPKKWRTNIPHYGKVRYQEVYPGIDLVFYGNPKQLEYDFVVAPGVDPRVIVLAFEGADRLEIDNKGNLILHIPGGQVIQRAPVIYQEIKDSKQTIDGYYVLRAKDQVAFQVASYDASKPLIIDPELVYSSYLGGSLSDQGFGIAVDATGNVYVTGSTDSAEFPTTAGAFDTTQNGGEDVFVTKLNAAGSALVYSTFLGGTGTDRGLGIAVDGTNNAYITGVTDSDDFPTHVNAFQGARAGLNDAFVTKINATGSALLYSSYLGGSLNDQGNAIAVDSASKAYITGETNSVDFPTDAQAPQGDLAVAPDAFVAKIDPDQAGADSLIYSTYLGGNQNDRGFGIAVDAALRAYVTGMTDSGNFPTQNPLQAALGGGEDAFVTRLNAAGSALEYSTYLGGGLDDQGNAITVDAANTAYVTGATSSGGVTPFPTTVGAFDTTFNGIQDAFVTKLNNTGTTLVYSTFVGGAAEDVGRGIAVDGTGNAYITGDTQSDNFPTAGSPFQAARASLQDAFITKLNTTGTGLVYSTYLGGSQIDIGYGIAVDPLDDAYVTGETGSGDFPTTAGAFDTTFNGVVDAFVAKVMEGPPAPNGAAGNGVAGGSCFIATAAFGSPMAPQVQLLRDLRARHLLTNAPGRLATAAYYRISPPLAEIVARSKPLRNVVRTGLVPVIGWTVLFMWSPVLGFTIPLAFLGLGSRVAFRAVRRYRRRK